MRQKCVRERERERERKLMSVENETVFEKKVFCVRVIDLCVSVHKLRKREGGTECE